MSAQRAGAIGGLTRQELMAEVRRALTHLYDAIYLQRSPLIALLPLLSNERIAPGQEARALRQVLLEAVDQLAPGANVPLRSEERRAYAVLSGSYVDQLERDDLAEVLGISDRQLRRELRAGIEAVTDILWRRSHEADAREPAAGQIIQAEIRELSAEAGPVNLCAEVREVQALVWSLARRVGVRVDDEALLESAMICANRILLRQALLALFSWAAERHPGAQLHVAVERGERSDVVFALTVIPCAAHSALADADEARDALPAELLAALQGTFRVDLCGDGALALRLTFSGMRMRSLLLVDDNPSIHLLFRRYLTGLPYQLHSAYDAEAGLELARSERPEVVVVDIMMPDRDGWELLAALKAEPELNDTPVVICSVLEQESLAASLAAAGYIVKPVTQNALLTALQALGLDEAP